MRIKHVEESSFVFLYIISNLYQGYTLNVDLLATKFEYDTSSIYKIFKKIDCYIIRIDDNVELICIKPKFYKFNFKT